MFDVKPMAMVVFLPFQSTINVWLWLWWVWFWIQKQDEMNDELCVRFHAAILKLVTDIVLVIFYFYTWYITKYLIFKEACCHWQKRLTHSLYISLKCLKQVTISYQNDDGTPLPIIAAPYHPLHGQWPCSEASTSLRPSDQNRTIFGQKQHTIERHRCKSTTENTPAFTWHIIVESIK